MSGMSGMRDREGGMGAGRHMGGQNGGTMGRAWPKGRDRQAGGEAAGGMEQAAGGAGREGGLEGLQGRVAGEEHKGGGDVSIRGTDGMHGGSDQVWEAG